MFTTDPLPAGVPMFSVMKCPQTTRIALERISRICSVARTVSSRRRIRGQAMGLVNRHESFLALRNRGALSILDASFKVARACYLLGYRRAMVNCALGTNCMWENSLSSQQ